MAWSTAFGRLRWTPLSLRRSLVLGAGLGILLPALLLGHYQFTRKLEGEIQARVRTPLVQYADMLTRGMGVAIWTADRVVAAELVDAVMANGDVVAVTVWDENREVFVHRERAGTMEGQLRDDRPIVYRGSDLGRVAVTMSTASVRGQVLQDAAKMALALGAQVVLSLFFVWLLFERRLIRPLQSLREGARRLAGGDLDHPIPCERDDEIGELAKGMEIMRVDLAALIARRRQAEKEKALLEAQFHQSQKLESLGSLAGGVAHDMNNVLGAILGLGSAHLELQPRDSPAFQAFETICRAAERGGKMVQSLLSFARQNPAEEQILDLNAILREEIRLLQCTTLARVRLQLDLAEGLRPVLGDPAALTHVFMNLCVNAVDAMGENGTLLLRTRDLPGGWVEALVEDSGPGMPADVLSKALDPFFTTKAPGKGTGLGLSVVYSTVRAHRGTLEIQSAPGEGTRVFLRFPACARVPAPAQAAGPLPRSAGGPITVLLVDDDELVLGSVRAMLDQLGHTVVTAPSGEAALEQLASGLVPEVVILDMNMPGMGGGGTLPHLRRLMPEVPVLLATGRPDQVALDLVEADGRLTLLCKPFDLAGLRSHLP